MRAVFADHVMFDEAIVAFRDRLGTDLSVGNTQVAVLTDFEVGSPLDCGLYQVLQTVRVTLPDSYCAVVAPLSIRGALEHHSAHLFAIALSTIMSFATGRPVKAPRDPYYVGKVLDDRVAAALAMSFPLLYAGPGMHELVVAPTTLEAFGNAIRSATRVLRELPYEDYVRVIRAMRLVQLAHQSVRDDFALAYYLLVSAVEIVATHAVPRKDVAERHPDEEGWNEAAKTEPTVRALLRAYRDERGKNKYLRKRFVQFVLRYCPPTTWAELEHPLANLQGYLEGLGISANYDHLTRRSPFEVYPEDLPEPLVNEVLGDLYTYRSNFTHEGSAPPNRNPTSYNRFFDQEFEYDEDARTSKRLLLPNYRLVAFIAQRSILTYATRLVGARS